MPGPLSRLRERVGVRVFTCRNDFVSHEAQRTQSYAEKKKKFSLLLCVNSAPSAPLRCVSCLLN